MKETIIQSCKNLQEALLADFEASQAELDSKVAKQKAHKAVQIARDALSDIKLY
jgi:hypothetical protein